MLSAKTTSPCSYYSFGNFVNEAGRGPIEFQFTANFLQILEKFCSGRGKIAKNGLLEAFCIGSAAGRRPCQPAGSLSLLNPFSLAHQWFSCAIRGHSVDIHLAGANHPVHVDQTGICT